MVSTTSEQGLVAADNCTHAVSRSLRGVNALCGLGAITTITPGRYDTEDPLACVECSRALEPDPSEQ
ncbi:MAG: hypothetical protein QOF18_1006 [Frankiaceae bacterium]|nr:hypothetical protein [Frankiaceae bacterium]